MQAIKLNNKGYWQLVFEGRLADFIAAVMFLSGMPYVLISAFKYADKAGSPSLGMIVGLLFLVVNTYNFYKFRYSRTKEKMGELGAHLDLMASQQKLASNNSKLRELSKAGNS